MKKLMLANSDYYSHMTDEGNQLQQGLKQNGWQLSGKGFDDIQDCRQMLEVYTPDIVLVHDKRDWDQKHYWAIRRDIGFTHLEALRAVPHRLAVVKDAGSMIIYHKFFCEEIEATGVVTYYHDDSVLKESTFLKDYPRYRTYHTVDANWVFERCNDYTSKRQRCVVSGALGFVYPLRSEAVQRKAYLQCHDIPHPGYNNKGTKTGMYLQTLSKFKVHIATASIYHFALRKIIESVAVGCVPITNLPAYDKLPLIDEALVRVPDNISMHDLKLVIDEAERTWDPGHRHMLALKCLTFYDFRHQGKLLSNAIEAGAYVREVATI